MPPNEVQEGQPIGRLTFEVLHEQTPHLAGPKRLEFFEALPKELQEAMYSNLELDLDEGRRDE